CIVLDVTHFNGPLHLEASGGDGGNTNDTLNKTGPGGYGSGGVVWHSGNKLPDHITLNLSNGKAGMHLPSNTAWGATTSQLPDGIVVKKLVSPLRGFLFNFLGQKQLLCSNDTTIPLDATTPKGGDGVYKIEWQISYDRVTWDTAPGEYKMIKYFPGPDIQQAYFRRIISSADIIDTSNILEFSRFLQMENNIIEGDQSVCEGSTPNPLVQKLADTTGAASDFFLVWEARTTDQEKWDVVFESSNSPDYTPLPLYETTYFRRIVYSGLCSNISNTVTINIKKPPLIIQHPTGDTIYAGKEYTFYISASGDPPLTYQWMKDNSELSGSTDTVLKIFEADQEDSGEYFCLVSNVCGSISSNTVKLFIKDPPHILVQPAGDSITAGEEYSFHISASGSQPLYYQWMKDNSEIPGSSDTVLMIPEADPEDSGQYFCLVSNEYGSISSDTVMLFIVEDQTGIDEKQTNSDLVTIFPNPATHSITIQHQLKGSFEVSVFDLLGNLVLKQFDNEQINLEHLPSGTYILNFSCPSNSFQQSIRLIIK
ncbi:MAG: hypothetical protein AMS27_16025, partial [Bacteroides sp. SM23_62_1]